MHEAWKQVWHAEQQTQRILRPEKFDKQRLALLKWSDELLEVALPLTVNAVAYGTKQHQASAIDTYM